MNPFPPPTPSRANKAARIAGLAGGAAGLLVLLLTAPFWLVFSLAFWISALFLLTCLFRFLRRRIAPLRRLSPRETALIALLPLFFCFWRTVAVSAWLCSAGLYLGLRSEAFPDFLGSEGAIRESTSAMHALRIPYNIQRLARRFPAKALPVLLARLSDPHPRLRWAAAYVLLEDYAWCRERPSSFPLITGPLISALADPEPEVRSTAAAALGHVGGPAVVEPLL